METPFKRMTNFIREIGADDVSHSERTYLAHAIGVHNDLKRWGGDDDLCKAGLFHSIYGTELFQRFTLPLDRRSEVRELTGERAEWLAYLNCAMDRTEFDKTVFQTAGPYYLRDRFTGEDVELSDEDFNELVRLHLCDWLEQVGHSKRWDYRRAAYRQMARRLGGIAAQEYRQVFAQEQHEQEELHKRGEATRARNATEFPGEWGPSRTPRDAAVQPNGDNSGMSNRVLLGGIFHETHTFLEGHTPLEAFRIRRAEELFDARHDGSPLDGVLETAEDCGWNVVPTIDVRATPSATVADDVLETWWREFEQRAVPELQRSIDGIFLVLHGAMVCETVPDVEGEILRRIRQLSAAAHIPLCAVYDLHGNISPQTAELSQGMVAYRECPHTDSREAAVRAARLLDEIMASGRQPVCCYEQPPVMWPPTGTGTADDPMRTLEAMAREMEQSQDDIAVVNAFAGFSFADTRHTGVSFSAVTFGDPAEAQEHLRRLSRWAVEHREVGNMLDPPLDEVLPDIRQQVARGEGPVLIVEPADNVGGGAPGDATTVLRALIDEGIEHSAVVINDPDTVAQLQEVASGETVPVSIGGKGSRLTDGPLRLDVELVSRSDGRFKLEDRHSHLASMNGIHIDMGPSALVRHKGVQILLTSRKTPPFDLGQLRSQGIEPEPCSVIGVKAAVAHRRAYDPIARHSYTVSTPGPCSSNLRLFPWKHIRRPVFPLDDVSGDERRGIVVGKAPP